ADRGGAYGPRAATLAAVACASAAVAMVGTVASGNLLIVVPLAFIVALGSGMVRAWGTSEGSAGVPVILTFLAALALPVVGRGWGPAVELAGLILLGGGWAMLL